MKCRESYKSVVLIFQVAATHRIVILSFNYGNGLLFNYGYGVLNSAVCLAVPGVPYKRMFFSFLYPPNCSAPATELAVALSAVFDAALLLEN